MIGKRIGVGGCSEVFEWEDGKAIKLFFGNTVREAVAREFANTQAAWQCNLPVPRPYQLIEYDGRPGIVFERISGETLKDRFARQLADLGSSGTGLDPASLDHKDNDIRLIARLLCEIHGKSMPDMFRDQKQSLKYSMGWPEYLTNDEKQRIAEWLDHLPGKSRLCHGDPNPNNIFMRNGKLVIIDWMNATTGNPEADIAEFIIMFRHAVLPADTPAFVVESFNAVRETINEILLDEYMTLSGMSYEEIDAWILPVAARKLSADAISEEEKAILVRMIRDRLSALPAQFAAS